MVFFNSGGSWYFNRKPQPTNILKVLKKCLLAERNENVSNRNGLKSDAEDEKMRVTVVAGNNLE